MSGPPTASRFARPAAPALLLAGLLAAVGCASGAGGGHPERPDLRAPDVPWHELWPELADGPTVGEERFDARPWSEQQQPLLLEAQSAWLAGDDARFAELRAQLGDDPVGALWLTRMLIHFTVRQWGPPEDDEEVLVGSEPWRRPYQELVDMGAAAAPTIVLDLLRDPDADRRLLGAELLRDIGEPALPALRRMLDVEDARARRYAMRAVAGFEPPSEAARALLEIGTRDPDFGVRAAAWRGFVHGPEDAARLRRALATEDDPYVRRSIVHTLGAHDDPASARALLDELRRALDAKDEDAVVAAGYALRRAAGDPSLTSLTDFQTWVDGLTPGDRDD